MPGANPGRAFISSGIKHSEVVGILKKFALLFHYAFIFCMIVDRATIAQLQSDLASAERSHRLLLVEKEKELEDAHLEMKVSKCGSSSNNLIKPWQIVESLSFS